MPTRSPAPVRLALLLSCAAGAACNPGGSGQPSIAGPAAEILAPVEETVVVTPGTPVGFAASCTAPGASHAWDFGGGDPAQSAAAAPGAVVFSAEGSHAVSYRCTGDQAFSAGLQRTVVVRQPRPSAFQLELRYLTTLSATQRVAFEDAAARVRQVVVGALPAARARGVSCADVTVDEDVPGLLILARVDAIDGVGGVLGQAGPCAIRGTSHLPLVGEMEFDSADLAALEASGRLRSVVLHEMLHVLGFGTEWEDDGLLQGAGGSDPRFRGEGASGAYQDWNGGHAATVPVESGGGEGTRDSHWRESALGSELMTGWLSGTTQPLSRTTVGSLADLGYDVEPLAADPFPASALAGARDLDDLPLGRDVLPRAPVVVY